MLFFCVQLLCAQTISIIAISFVFLTTSCAEISFIEDGKKITSKHLSLAIIPPIINNLKCLDLDDVNCIRENNLDTEALYQNLYRHVFHKNATKHYRLKIPTKDKILKTLRAENINIRSNKDYNRLCKALEVDAVLVPTFFVSKPTSPGASIATDVASSILFGGLGFSTTTNFIEGQLFIYDHKTSQKIWSYKHKEKGSYMESKKGIQTKLMSDIARKMPYY